MSHSLKSVREDLADLSPVREDESFLWITSYSDLVTLLLCFFILFFAIYSKRTVLEIKKKAATAAEQKLQKLTDPETIGLLTKEINEKFARLDAVFSLIHEIPGIETVKRRDHFLIIFNDGNFFDAGEYNLNIQGQYRMALVLERLIQNADKVFVEIQGHSDNTPVSNKHKKYSTNIELSTLRALSVFNYFKQFGFPDENMSVSGFAHHRPIIDEEDEEESLLAKNRRITFRIEGK